MGCGVASTRRAVQAKRSTCSEVMRPPNDPTPTQHPPTQSKQAKYARAPRALSRLQSPARRRACRRPGTSAARPAPCPTGSTRPAGVHVWLIVRGGGRRGRIQSDRINCRSLVTRIVVVAAAGGKEAWGRVWADRLARHAREASAAAGGRRGSRRTHPQVVQLLRQRLLLSLLIHPHRARPPVYTHIRRCMVLVRSLPACLTSIRLLRQAVSSILPVPFDPERNRARTRQRTVDYSG